MSDAQPTQASPAPGRRIIVMAVLAAVALMGAVIPFLSEVDDSLGNSQPVRDGLEAARSNPQVSAALGNRIRAGDPIIGSLTEQGSTAEVDLTIPLRGSAGEGTLYVIGSRTDGHWSYSTLAVRLPDRANLITLEQP